MKRNIADIALYFGVAIPLALGLIWLARQIPAIAGNDYLTILPPLGIAIYVSMKLREKVFGKTRLENEV